MGCLPSPPTPHGIYVEAVSQEGPVSESEFAVEAMVNYVAANGVEGYRRRTHAEPQEKHHCGMRRSSGLHLRGLERVRDVGTKLGIDEA
jgi:hypothetical protein